MVGVPGRHHHAVMPGVERKVASSGSFASASVAIPISALPSLRASVSVRATLVQVPCTLGNDLRNSATTRGSA